MQIRNGTFGKNAFKKFCTGRTEHQDTKMTSMRPRLKELNDNPCINLLAYIYFYFNFLANLK